MRPFRNALSRRLRLPLWALAIGLFVHATARADADHAPSMQEWPVERNAQVLAHREWKLGLWGFDGGIVDRLQVGTLWWSWLLASPNVHLKALLLDHGPYRLAFDTSFLYLDLNRVGSWLGDDDVQGGLSVLPLEMHFDALVHPRLQVGGTLGYSFTHTSPEYDPQNFEGSGGYDSLFVSGRLTARASRRLWIVAEVDWVLYQGVGAIGRVEQQVDPFVYVSGEASRVVSPLAPASGGAITASLVVRQRRFGMRLGVGYGNLVLPRLRIVVPTALPYATLDFYARFGKPYRERRRQASDSPSPDG